MSSCCSSPAYPQLPHTPPCPQALLSLHEQLLLMTPRRAPGSAQDLWDSLRAAMAPHVPGEVTLQQV